MPTAFHQIFAGCWTLMQCARTKSNTHTTGQKFRVCLFVFCLCHSFQQWCTYVIRQAFGWDQAGQPDWASAWWICMETELLGWILIMLVCLWDVPWAAKSFLPVKLESADKSSAYFFVHILGYSLSFRTFWASDIVHILWYSLSLKWNILCIWLYSHPRMLSLSLSLSLSIYLSISQEAHSEHLTFFIPRCSLYEAEHSECLVYSSLMLAWSCVRLIGIDPENNVNRVQIRLISPSGSSSPIPCVSDLGLFLTKRMFSWNVRHFWAMVLRETHTKSCELCQRQNWKFLFVIAFANKNAAPLLWLGIFEERFQQRRQILPYFVATHASKWRCLHPPEPWRLRELSFAHVTFTREASPCWWACPSFAFCVLFLSPLPDEFLSHVFEERLCVRMERCANMGKCCVWSLRAPVSLCTRVLYTNLRQEEATTQCNRIFHWALGILGFLDTRPECEFCWWFVQLVKQLLRSHQNSPVVTAHLSFLVRQNKTDENRSSRQLFLLSLKRTQQEI